MSWHKMSWVDFLLYLQVNQKTQRNPFGEYIAFQKDHNKQVMPYNVKNGKQNVRFPHTTLKYEHVFIL